MQTLRIIQMLLVAGFCLDVQCENPGFKTRVTERGINYIKDVFIEVLKKNIQTWKLPDYKTSRYSAFNSHVTSLTPPSSQVKLIPEKGIYLNAVNANVSIQGDFSYHLWFIRGGGSFDASVNGLGFGVNVDIVKDVNGRPSMTARKCSQQVGNVDFKFKGSTLSWLFNFFRGYVAREIKSFLERELCSTIYKLINEDSKKTISNLNVTSLIAKVFLFDYRLTKDPVFGAEFVDTFHQGEIFWMNDTTAKNPLIPPPMPENNDTQNMVHLWISDYIFNTFGQVAHAHGFLKYTLKACQLSEYPKVKAFLNTTCSLDSLIPKCIGRVLPKIGKMYPNGTVDIRMTSFAPPTMDIDTGGVLIKFPLTIDLYATGEKSSESAFLLSARALMSSSVKITEQSDLLYGEFKNLEINMNVTRSVIGIVIENELDMVANFALKLFIVPELNKIGRKGLRIPSTRKFHFTNASLSYAKNTLLVSTDVTYLPSAMEVTFPDIDLPFFKPCTNAESSILHNVDSKQEQEQRQPDLPETKLGVQDADDRLLFKPRFFARKHKNA